MKYNLFKKIPLSAFRDFHNSFRIDTSDICTRCGGRCETNKISSLMPGEAEYIASSLNMKLKDFKDAYLDGIETPYGIVDVLKLKSTCPFLSEDFICTLKDIKVILCEIYPIVFEAKENSINFFLDNWCPITRHSNELSEQFIQKGIPALLQLYVPLEWYKAVELYDNLCVDYDKIFSLRNFNLDYVVISLDEIKECRIDETELPELNIKEFKISPSKILKNNSINQQRI
jgi:Fe-S-cluster containining protein